jgi:hypothetical protein
MPADDSALASAWRFFAVHWTRVLGVSAALLAPCFWHRHVEAGDLPSHLYNAWLAQLIEKGGADGLYLATQFSNILFDVSLLHLANFFGFWLAEKIAVSACVLIFFWGVFALVSAVTDDAQWTLTPLIAMLAYGYAFNMGFMNYYLSVGLGCFTLALVWPVIVAETSNTESLNSKGKYADSALAAILLALAWLAHPIGCLWALSTIAYIALRRRLPGRSTLIVPAAVAILLAAFRWYLHRHSELAADWFSGLPFWQSTGADQLIVYGDRYETLSWLALAFGAICVIASALRNRRNIFWWKELALPIELYVVAFVAIATFPENFRVSMYATWIGLLVSRLTLICAILGLCVLARAQMRSWAFAGFLALATAYFVFLALDTRTLSQLEANAEAAVATLPAETRIIPTIKADPNWRVEFIAHVADRACIRHCFVYSNYEPSSRQFRVRIEKRGSPLVTDSAENADDMQGGGYEIEKRDLPVTQLYQCDPSDWTKLCLRPLKEAQNTGQGISPPK